MAQTQKAFELNEYLAEEIKARTALAVATGFDAVGDLYLNVGAGVAEGKNAYIRVRADGPSLFKNIVGLAQEVYTPHRIDVIIEAVKGDGTEPLPTFEKALLFAIVFGKATRVDIYESATGTAPALAGLPQLQADGTYSGGTGTFKVTVQPNAQYPMLLNQ